MYVLQTPEQFPATDVQYALVTQSSPEVHALPTATVPANVALQSAFD